MARSATHVFDIEIEINLFNQSLLKTATLAENIQKALDTQPVSPGTAVPSAVAGVLNLTATTNATQPFPSVRTLLEIELVCWTLHVCLCAEVKP